MKLFENGVGRPSNEIKRKRKIFIASAIVLCITLVSVLAFALTKVSTKSLKGASNGTAYIDLHAKVGDTYVSGCNYIVPAIIENRSQQNIRVYYAKITDSNNNKYTEVSASKTISKGYGQTDTVTLKFPINDAFKKGYYKEFSIRLVVYFKINNGKEFYHTDTISLSDSLNTKIKNCGTTTKKTTTKKTTTKKTTTKKTTTNNSSSSGTKYIDLHAKVGDTYVSGCDFVVPAIIENRSQQNIKVYYAKLTSPGNTKYTEVSASKTISKGYGQSGTVNLKFPITKALKDAYSNNFTLRLVVYFTINNGSKFYHTDTLNYTSTIYNKMVNCKTTTTTKAKDFNLTCSKTAVYVGDEFTCRAALKDAKVTVGGAKSLASGYASSFTAGQNEARQTIKIKYAERLFTDYKSQIKTDSNGKRYINAKISASKSGYNSKYVIVRIYEKVSNSSNTLTLNCPASAKTYEAFKCTTDQAGVKITVGGAKALASGYSSVFTTTSSDKAKDIKYTNALFNGDWSIKKDSDGKEYVNAKVTAKKDDKEKTMWVKIYKGTEPSSNSGGSGNSNNTVTESAGKTTAKKTMTLSCTNAHLNEEFTCKASVAGAKIKVSSTKYLVSGYKGELTTSKASDVLKLKYKSTGTITVTATKSGYETVTKKVTVTRPLKVTCTTAYLNEEFTCSVNVAGAKMKVSSTKYLVSGYKGELTTKNTSDKLKLKYKSTGTIKVTATKSGYNSKSVSVKVTRRPATTAKKDDNFSSDEIYYSINKVMKNEEFGSKTLEFKIKRVGKDVEKVQFIVCNDKEQCVNYNTNSNNPTTGLKEAKVGNIYKLNIFTVGNELLNQKFYVRMISYDKDGKEIYFKVHEFYTNLVTDKNSPNESIDKEEDVTVGDYTGTTHDLIISEHTLKELKTGRLNYNVTSITKLDNNGKKQLNVFIRTFASDVRYVTFVVCNDKSDCNKSDVIEQVSKNNEIGTVVKDVEVSHGKKLEILLNSKSNKLLSQKVYIRIFTYDENMTMLYTKMHEFATSSASKNNTKTESSVKVGERVSTNLTFLSSNVFSN